MAFLEIEQVTGRMILDSRGTPTVEAEVRLRGGAELPMGRKFAYDSQVALVRAINR